MPKDDDIRLQPTTVSTTASAAAGSSTTPPGPDPMEAVRQRINALQSKINDIPTKVRLTDLRDAAENVEVKANRVADLANQVREFGYAWEKDLEPRCIDYRRRWQDLKPQVMAAIDRESTAFQNRVLQVTYQGNYAIQHATTPANSEQALTDGERAVNALFNDIDAATRSIRGMYDQFSTDLDKQEKHLQEIKQMLDRAAQSKVQWLPGEAVVRAVKAKWDRDGMDDPNGYLYLTDQRVIFERDEDVATKKFLFIATEKQHVQETMVEAKLGETESVEASKRGVFGNEDHLDFKFGASVRVRQAHFHIDGQDANEWQGDVNRAKTGGLDAMRVAPISDAEQTRLKNAPTKCSNCGSPLTAPILRGQTEIKCPACGTVSRF